MQRRQEWKLDLFHWEAKSGSWICFISFGGSVVESVLWAGKPWDVMGPLFLCAWSFPVGMSLSPSLAGSWWGSPEVFSAAVMGAEHSGTGCAAEAAAFLWQLLRAGIRSLVWAALLTACFVPDTGVGGLLAFEMMSHVHCWLARICCISCCISCCFQPSLWAFVCSAWDPIHSSCCEGCLHSVICLSCRVKVDTTFA